MSALFERLKGGDESARAELFPLVYAELHRLARVHMAGQRLSHTLQPTALVNEAFLKLGSNEAWSDRSRFLGLASVAMRQILVDHARAKRAAKRGGDALHVELDQIVAEYEHSSHGLLELDDCLEKLKRKDPDLVRLVELRFFAGSTIEEAARELGISVRQASRWWNVARAYLKRELGRD